ncbi:MAG TPA: MFS transporter [Anaerolineales bacterium]|nr:MFS transporter [Anaerolineales bacterium]
MQAQAVDFSRKWLVMGAVGMGIFLATLDGSIVNVALPTLVEELNTDFATLEWVVVGYLLTVCTLVLGVGRLGDMLGKKPIYAAGFLLFTLGSVLCGLASSVGWLIGFRVLQGVGASMVFGLGTAILTEAFPPAERGKALGISGAVVSLGIVVGPTLGGLLIDLLSWNWIFFVNLPVGLLGTWMVLRHVPAFRPSARQEFDLPGAAFLCLGLLALLFGLSLGQRQGFGAPFVLALLGMSLVLLLLFIRIERRASQPMLDLGLMRRGQFSVNLLTGAITFLSIAGTLILMPFYLQNVLGHPPREVGLLLAVVPTTLAVVSPIAGSLSDRFGTRPMTVLGLLTLLGGYLALSGLRVDTTSREYLMRFLPVGIGMGLFQSPNNSAIMGAAPRHQLGVASSLLAITRLLGQISGIAVLGALWAGRVGHYGGGLLEGGASSAHPSAQVAALQETLLVIVILVGGALLLSLWAYLREKGNQRVVQPEDLHAA